MEWYGWLILGIALLAIGIAKIIFVPKYFKKLQQKSDAANKRME